MCKIVFFVASAISLILNQSAAVCHICKSNGVACASNNTFHLCFRGLPNIAEEFSCPNEDEVCTALGQVCMDPSSNSNIQAACGNTKQCGQCADVMDGGFTCTSRTTFTMCMGYALTNVHGSCRPGQVCRTSLALTGRVPCVNECLTDPDDMCDVNAAVDAPPSSESAGTTVIIQPTPPISTTTTATSTNPTTAEVPTNTLTTTSSSTGEYCSSQTLIGRYPNPADNSCRTYLYCSSSRTGSRLVGRVMRCPAGKFFNPQIRNCQSVKPSGCV